MENIVQFDDSWTEFVQKLNSVPLADYQQACDVTGMNLSYLNRVIENSIENWRDSTSTSLINGMFHVSLGQVPTGDMFSDYKWQTRFIIMAKKTGLLSPMDIKPIKDKKGQLIIVMNVPAATVDNIGIKTLNKIARALYVYWFVNSKKNVKLPKFIYRGIRAGDLFENKNITLKNAIDSIWKADETYAMRRKKAIDVLIHWICDRKLHEITDSNILSFTSNVGVAKYFTRGEGFCLRLDPRTVNIITSELHDKENVGGPEPFHGKIEHEYIVKIPENYAFTKDDIIINDLDYFVADENPLSLALFDHDDKIAYYTMDGIALEAYFEWNMNGDKGRLMFSKKGQWHSANRVQFKKNFGFDPLPNEKNLSSVTEFKISPRKKQW